MEHARDKDSAICYHLDNCEKYQHLLSLSNFPCNNSILVNTKEFLLNTVRDNTSIIDEYRHEIDFVLVVFRTVRF